MFASATAFQAEFTCTDANHGPASSCVCTGCIPDASWHSFVAECLAIAPVDGLCTTWDKYSTYGAMPDWDTSLVTDMTGYTASTGAFKGFGDKSLFNADISKWDTRRVTDMHDMFYACTAFNQDIGNWNTSQVTNMYAMFAQASAFNQDIGSWNTAQVTGMDSMFNQASAFNQDIGNWNTEKVTIMSSMFNLASAFNQDISSWNGTAATTVQTKMFTGATAFQAKFDCDNAETGPAQSCSTIKSTWVAPPPPASYIYINGKQLYQDSDGWILLLAYDHVGGESNALVPGEAPLSPTGSYSHIWLDDLSLTADNVESVRFYCTSSGHSRVVHFETSNVFAKSALVSDTATGNKLSYWTSGTTKFSDHTAFIPDATNEFLNSIVEFPFYKAGENHWAIRGDQSGDRWECDDAPYQTGARDRFSTVHQIWFKQAPP